MGTGVGNVGRSAELAADAATKNGFTAGDCEIVTGLPRGTGNDETCLSWFAPCITSRREKCEPSMLWLGEVEMFANPEIALTLI